jgi:hypothetical protein
LAFMRARSSRACAFSLRRGSTASPPLEESAPGTALRVKTLCATETGSKPPYVSPPGAVKRAGAWTSTPLVAVPSSGGQGRDIYEQHGAVVGEGRLSPFSSRDQSHSVREPRWWNARREAYRVTLFAADVRARLPRSSQRVAHQALASLSEPRKAWFNEASRPARRRAAPWKA